MTEHPISLPPKLWDKWIEDGCDGFLAACEAARWGADQELEGCCEWLRSKDILEPAIEALRAVRRPKPPSLAEQALTQLDSLHADLRAHGLGANTDTIRYALERLQELEEGNE